MTKTRQVLVIDDDPDMGDIYKSILEMNGVGAYAARSGEEALRKIGEDESRFDLILVDVRMPPMDGPEFVAEVQGRFPGLAQKVPIVFLTGMDEMPSGTVARGFIRKTADLDQFIEKAMAYLAGQG